MSLSLITGITSIDDFDITLTKKFYDCYSLSLNDMQVIVGRIKDNWRLAHLAGTSNLHVLDKFSITLQCERRIVSSADPGKFLLNLFGINSSDYSN